VATVPVERRALRPDANEAASVSNSRRELIAGRLQWCRAVISDIFSWIYRCLEAAGAIDGLHAAAADYFTEWLPSWPDKRSQQCDTPNWAAPGSMSPGSALVA
jgi:hypothetical protein